LVVQFKDSSRFYHRWVVGFFTAYEVNGESNLTKLVPGKKYWWTTWAKELPLRPSNQRIKSILHEKVTLDNCPSAYVGRGAT
jgi:hypothetical protein